MVIEQARRTLAPPVQPGGRIRAIFWITLAIALVVTLAMPLSALWRASTIPLIARACVWPATPRANAQAQALIVVPDHADDAALAGNWATAQVTLTMLDMTMAAQRAEALGPPQRIDAAAVFMIPVTLTMPGVWLASITLHTPGRPDWHTSIMFQARPDTWSSLPVSTQLGRGANLCATSPSAAPASG